jgi:hypothetical protein
MKYFLGLVLTIVIALVAPLSANATLPKASVKLIVPNKSIGGVALGDRPSQVTRAWGANPDCTSTCIYEAKAKPGEGTAGASALLEQKRKGAPYKVWSVLIYVSQKTVGNKTVPNFKTPLTKFRTAKGIGLGSTVTALKHAYHGLKRVSEPSGFAYYELNGPGEKETGFTASPSKKITQIVIRSHPGG